MKNLKVFWPSFISIAISISLVSCVGDMIEKKEAKKNQFDMSNYQFEKVYQPPIHEIIDYDFEENNHLEEENRTK